MHGSVIKIEATVQCGGCDQTFVVELDQTAGGGTEWTIRDEVLFTVENGDLTTIQGDTLLCEMCTALIFEYAQHCLSRLDVKKILDEHKN